MLTNNCWHCNNDNGSSFIVDLLNLMTEDDICCISTDIDFYEISPVDDRIVVGSGAILIQSNARVLLLNTNYIHSVEILKGEHLNNTSGKDINGKQLSVHDSEKEN